MSDTLSKQLLFESAAGVTAASLVAPAIAIIDKSIIQNTAGTVKLSQGIKQGFIQLFTNPSTFLKSPPFLMIWGVYSLTYITGNTIEAACKYFKEDSFTPKFIGSSIVNVGCSVGKDVVFTRMFGVGSPKPLPVPSALLFASRDSLTILAGFSLPPVVAKEVAQRTGCGYEGALVASQLIVPCAMQFVSSPMHLIGLDLYNRPSGSERWNVVRRDYWATCAARIGRIFPAYGIGGVLNREIRKFYRDLF